MKPMTRVYPKLRLQAALGGPRGITVQSAIARGEAGMEEHRGASFEIVDESLAALRSLCAPGNAPINVQAVFDHAETVVDLAGLFSPSLCRAAQSLCTLAQAGIAGDRVERAPIVVHVESLQLLRALEGVETPETDAILTGLLAVTAKSKSEEPGL